MKINNYKLFLESKQTKEDIDLICQKYYITNYTINEDGTVDVDGDVDLSRKRLTELPLKFGRVNGYFACDYNLLKKLEGSPKYVGFFFSCGYNDLKTLEGGPKVVIDSYYCAHNNLVNFKGFPEDYYEYSYFANNPIFKLLKDIPQDKINKFIYWCNEFDSIDNEGNEISLKGSPKCVVNYFGCYNNKLKTLEGGPETVIGDYYCSDNNLVSFKGFPEDYELYVNFYGNPVYKLFGPIPIEKWNKFIYWCNEFDAIDNEGNIIPERMEEVYNQIGLIYNNNEN